MVIWCLIRSCSIFLSWLSRLLMVDLLFETCEIKSFSFVLMACKRSLWCNSSSLQSRSWTSKSCSTAQAKGYTAGLRHRALSLLIWVLAGELFKKKTLLKPKTLKSEIEIMLLLIKPCDHPDSITSLQLQQTFNEPWGFYNLPLYGVNISVQSVYLVHAI